METARVGRLLWIVGAAIWTSVVAGSSAHAAEYDATSLGAAPISYIEHRFDINASGRACFTGLVGGNEHAMYTEAGATPVDIHIGSGPLAANQTRAEGINDAGHIVGYRRTGPEIFRTAVLWRNTGSGYAPLNSLHAGLAGAPNISAAYEISDATAGTGAAYVVGYWRDTFKTPSKAVLWTIDASGNVLSTEPVPRSPGMDYNIAYGVNDDGIVVGGEGVFGGGSPPGTAMYAFIYDSVANTVVPVPGVQASDGYTTSVASAVSEHYVVGYALETATGHVTAFVHELGTTNTETGIKVGPNGGAVGPRSLAYSLREMAAARPIVYGLSEVNGSMGSMGGLVYDRAGTNPQECDVNASSDWSGRVTHVFAMNANGQGIGLRSDGGTEAVFIEDIANDAMTASVFKRDPQEPAGPSYYWGQLNAPGTPNSGAGAIIFSNSPGCGEAFSCTGSADLSDEGTSGTDFFITGSNPFDSGVAYTPQFSVDPSSFAYAQGIATLPNSCEFSDVVATPPATINPGGTDPWGDVWADCTGYVGAETNVSVSLDNCGACNTTVDDGKACTNDACNSGTIANDYDTSSNYCFISNDCVPAANDPNDPAATNPSNECQACYTNQDRYGYSNDPNGSSCADEGKFCTVDQCVSGSCDHSTIASNTCLVAGNCYNEGDENPSNECEACQSGSSQTSFTDDPNGTSCTDSDPYSCTVAQCQGGGCNQRASFTGCQIGSSCYAFNSDRPGNECQACRASNPEAWTNDSNGTGCNTDNCYSSQSCTSGSCGGGSPVVDSFEPDDTWQTRTHLGSWTEDDYWTGAGKNYRAENKTIFPENDDDWYSFYADDYACDRGRYAQCGQESYDCNCDWLGCSTCWRNKICNINCGFGGTASKNHDTESGANGNPQGMAQLVVPSGSDYEMCVYLQCNVDGGTPSSVNWFGNGSATGNVTINGASLVGRCGVNGGSTTETVEFHPDCPSENDSVLAFVRVYDHTNNARCNSTYQIRVGNDKD